MKTLTYYSYYPYNRDDFKVVNGMVQPIKFKLFLSAVCTTNNQYSDMEFLADTYEVLDSPEYNVDNYKEGEPYTLMGINVSNNANLYGATNPYDGAYDINHKYYVKTYDGWNVFDSLDEAALFCYNNLHKNYFYL